MTKKEEQIMGAFWEKGRMFVRELRELYPEPRTLESEGFLSHEAYGTSYQYFPAVTREEYSRFSLSGVVDKCFGNSYLGVVSALVKEEKISVDDLKELIDRIEKGE